MKMTTAWRGCFVLSAVLILAGGPMHPGGTMAEMLAHPSWVPAHALLVVAFAALLAGLLLYQRAVVMPPSTHAWFRWAVVGTLGQLVEMVMHTAAAVDHANLVAGRATPVLTTHLWMAVILYPIFGVTLSGFIVASARDRVLGSLWIAWVGVVGALAHGISAPLVVAFELERARVLFPLIMLFAAWQIAAALGPAPVAAGTRSLRAIGNA
jgi:nitrate reductase NapE component